MRVTHHGGDNLWVERIAQNRDEGKEEEESNVEDKEDVGENVQPVGMVGELVEDDRDDTGRHGDDEPSDHDLV